jgi:hypothetical protein
VIAPGQGTVVSSSFGTITDFTTTGNTVLGDATTDTLTVGVTGIVKNSSGNVGIGTSSPSQKLSVLGVIGASGSGGGNASNPSATHTSSSSVRVGLRGNLMVSDNVALYGVGTYLANNLFFKNATGYPGYIESAPACYIGLVDDVIRFHRIGTGTANADITSFPESMRIDSSGNFLVARTSAWTSNTSDNTTGFGVLAANGQTLVNATGAVNALIVNNTNTNNRLLSFRSANTEVGGVTITSSTATFNGTSDARLKEDLGVSTDTSVIDNTIIHDFKWTRDGTQGKGVFAQEAYEVYPLAVSKGSDELNESGNLANPWQVNYSQYIPDLIVYCQQLKKTVDTQAETINALTARIVALENR